jgi:hypothetical protein
MSWDPTQRENNIDDPNVNTGNGTPTNPYATPPQNPYDSTGSTSENPYAVPQNPYGAPPENPYAMPPYGYTPPYPAEPEYVPSQVHPLPLGEAIRQLPRQYFKVLTKPGAMTFAEEMGKAAWNIVWVQLIGLGIIYTLLGLLGFAIEPATTTTTTPTTPSTQQILTMVQLISRISFYATLGDIVLIPLFFFIVMGIIYGLARAFGGQGKFVTQGYTYLLFDVPLGIISSLLTLLPLAGLFLALGLLIYRIVLVIFSIMAVHRIGGGKASAVVLIPIAAGLILSCGLSFALVAYFLSQSVSG